MSNTNPDPVFELVVTSDGSPTLSLNQGEKMHSLDGALSESLYIYGPCIEASIESRQARVLSMGLGLGYNELIATALFMKAGIKDFHITSFEAVDILRQYFLQWLKQESSPLNETYQSINQLIAEKIGLNPPEIRAALNTAWEDQRFRLFEALPALNPTDKLYTSILYDAFSSETDKGLWTEEHLEFFVDQYCDIDICYFSTYAATGALKRSLIKKGFHLEKKAGFGKKRESTFAQRPVLK